MWVELSYPSLGAKARHHRFDKKCTGRFYEIDHNLVAIDTETLMIKKRSLFQNKEYYYEDFRKLNSLLQSHIIESLCQRCCKDIIELLLNNAQPEAIESSTSYFNCRREITFIRK